MATLNTFETIIVGTGFSGLGMAIRLKQQGKKSFVVLEKAAEVGPAFHSAEWDHQTDLTGKTVAVIGTGASAIQFVPQIAPKVKALHLFQRTPAWVMPKPDRAISEAERWLFRRVPATARALRYIIYGWMEGRGFGFTVNPNVMKFAAAMGRRHIRAQIKDPLLRKAVTPTYMPGCKRILIANDYFPALNRPNVSVVTEGIREIKANSIVTADGQERPVDAIIYGTGFHVTDVLTNLKVTGRNGIDINDAWRNGVEAYRGTTVSGFPNLFLLMGPNTGLGHNSMVFIIEAQIHYVLECMRTLAKRRKSFADVRPAAQALYNKKLQPRLQRAVWASGCQSWYLDANGRNTTAWPGFTFEFWAQTLLVKPKDYEFGDALTTITNTPAPQ